MGLFDWLKGSKEAVEIAADRIWLSKKAKLDGIQREIAVALSASKGPDALFVVAHFQDCLDQLRAIVASSDFDDDRIFVTLADALQGPSTFDESRNVHFIVSERHPLPTHDEEIVEFARSLACGCRVAFHMSLEDAMLQKFSGEWVEGVLRRLGMKENEAIESQMVSRRLKDAQRKIASHAIGDAPANSAQEWLERNCPAS